ncbi:MAG TPA: hypothetical protein VGD67_23955, partial [Pseudonocardiaceae bacterium]
MRRSRILPLLVVALAAAGCQGPDLARRTYPRTAVPAGQGPAVPSGLTAETLRLIDPCALLDPAALDQFGEIAENVPQDFGGCRNYMTTDDGAELSFTVRVGQSAGGTDAAEATKTLAGFPAETNTVDGACFVTLLVEEPEPDLGVELQVGLDDGDACEPARAVATRIGELLRAGAPRRTPAAGSLLPLDPCAAAGEL